MKSSESGKRVWEQDGGGGGIRFESDGQGGVHIIDLRHGHEDDGGLVFSIGREDTAKLARFLLGAAGGQGMTTQRSATCPQGHADCSSSLWCDREPPGVTP